MLQTESMTYTMEIGWNPVKQSCMLSEKAQRSDIAAETAGHKRNVNALTKAACPQQNEALFLCVLVGKYCRVQRGLARLAMGAYAGSHSLAFSFAEEA